MTSLVASVEQLSLPRDCLQAERSLLQYCKFAGVLSLMSLAVLLDLTLDDTKTKDKSASSKRFSLAIGIIMFAIGAIVLGLGLYNYFDITYRLVGQRSLHGIPISMKFVLIITMIVLLALNVMVLIEI